LARWNSFNEGDPEEEENIAVENLGKPRLLKTVRPKINNLSTNVSLLTGTGRPTLRQTNLSNIDETHFIALDPNEDCALILIKK
jgi:hypothetical protein